MNTCPSGCGHPVDRHGLVRVSFNPALSAEQDYDAMTCSYTRMTTDKHGHGRYEDCGCCVPLDRWKLASEEPRQEALPL